MMRRGLRAAGAYGVLRRGHRGQGVPNLSLLFLSTAEDRTDSEPTPDATRLAFTSTVYGKDPDSGMQTPEEAAAAEALKQKVGGVVTAEVESRAHDSRAMYDSSLAQQAGDEKSSESIKRDVTTDTPDITRLAFSSTVYGKDPHSTELTAAQAEAAEALKEKAGKAVYGAAAPIHDQRSLFDSGMAQAYDDKTSDTINREVSTDTPDTTRLAFHATVYGKDPEAASELSGEDAATVESLKQRAVQEGRGVTAAPIHHQRSMFDSDMVNHAGDKSSGDVNREVATDTPDITRLAFRATVYGKDPDAAVLSVEDEVEVASLTEKAGCNRATETGPKKTGYGSIPAAPIHDTRAMFDSVMGNDGAHADSSSVKRDVATDTPDETRLSFFGSTYGEDAVSDKQAATAEVLKGKVGKAKVPEKKSKVHDTKRAMFDSDYQAPE